MENKDLENSVPSEQFSDNAENTNIGESIEKMPKGQQEEIDEVKNNDAGNEKPASEITEAESDAKVDAENKAKAKAENEAKAKAKAEVEAKVEDLEVVKEEEVKEKSDEVIVEVEAETEPKVNDLEVEKEEEVKEKSDEEVIVVAEVVEEVAEGDVTSEVEEDPVAGEATNMEEDKVVAKDGDEDKNKDVNENIKIENKQPEEVPVDYTKLNKSDLVKCVKELIDNKPVNEIKRDVEIIKASFYKLNKTEVDQIKNQFIKDGGNIEDFKPQEDNLELELKDLLIKFKILKTDYNKLLENDKEKNLKEKYLIIDKIKDLVNSKESINKTFNEFRELQQQWRDSGLVPQQKVKDLWETYHHHVEVFYDFIKINQELRDIDLKKNLEEKIKSCEKAEDLLLGSSIVKSFEELQKLHIRWREIGPVPREHKESTWERFKVATNIINKKHQEYFEELKKSQKNNLEAKTTLCDKVEEILNSDIANHKSWETKSQEVKELQKIWRTIGFAPKKNNNIIYQRFRTTCDNFFTRKREFYAENKEVQSNNLQNKLDLCEQAEALKDSSDWKKTSEDLISLQAKWKNVGPVPKRQSDEVWKRFRTACDVFFNRKKDFYSNIDEKYEENLKKKNAIIEEINAINVNEDIDNSITKLKDYQRQWSEIGYVPINDKERIQKEYRDAINNQFDKLNIDDDKRNVLKFKNKITTLSGSPKFDNRLQNEREKFINKLKTLENNIVLWENNIGFFANSKNAESVIEDVRRKIEKAKEDVKILEEKINIIDNLN